MQQNFFFMGMMSSMYRRVRVGNHFILTFYTDVAPGVKYHDTIFKARPSEGVSKKLKTDVKEGSKNFVKKVIYKLNLKRLFNKYE